MRRGVAIGVAPHLVLLVWVVVLAVSAEPDSRAYVPFYGLLEIYLAPAGVVAGLLLCWRRSRRPLAGGVAAGTVLGFLLVVACSYLLAGLLG
ncbi:hypothetical protein [Actinoplanes teichomyceticus]|uniref:Uncharacterized protein n=1 Tax=Actinoplanes teichomyceticus TaxID=1867 RepID=A0A561VMM4_ACTTI|nr:hypothetical protein [Actinoplanes teichomyceticus]TWG12874.1 hypothetical protein FHX34_105742 [Actinoplanes teichomyceticus]GIF13621.1 hypothetical protein Ate01nite_36530 [Actinoplanes teichomyceticus]